MRDYTVGQAGGASFGRHTSTLTLTCTMFQAGEGPNTVPASARLTFDYRTLPDQAGADEFVRVADVVIAAEMLAASAQAL